MINATVSHEMRTPLNSIIAQNRGTHHNHESIKEIISDIGQLAKEKKLKELTSLVKNLETVTY